MSLLQEVDEASVSRLKWQHFKQNLLDLTFTSLAALKQDIRTTITCHMI